MAHKCLAQVEGSFESEVLPFWEKIFDFVSENDPRTYENYLCRLYVYYEAIGPAVWRAQVITRRGQEVHQDEIIPERSDGSIQIVVFDMKSSDVIQKIIFSVLCGAASIVLFSCEMEPKGQLVKNT